MFNIPSSDDDEFEELISKEETSKALFERRKEFIPSQNLESLKTQVGAKNETTASKAEDSNSKVPNTVIAKPVGQAGDSKETAASETGTSGNSAYRIAVNRKQKGNPILKFIRNVPWEYDAIIPDYELGRTTCALYLSVKYHNRFPDYVHNRLKELGKSYELRILLVQVDTKQQDISHELNELAKMCILADCTMVLAFSLEEAGRYLEVYKAYENKPPTEIMGKTKQDFLSQATEFLTAVKGVNKTDVTTLLTKFKTIKAIINADVDSLSLCPGIGPVKARRLHNAFSSPFLRQASTTQKHNLSSQETTSGDVSGQEDGEDDL